MELKRAPIEPVMAARQEVASTPSRGAWLIFARVAWLIWAGMALTLIIVGIPPLYRQATTGEPIQDIRGAEIQAEFQSELWRLSPADVSSLQGLGFSLDSYAIYRIVAQVSISLLFVLVASIIFWRRAASGIAFLASLTLLTLGVTASWPILIGAVVAWPAFFLPTQILTSSAFPLLILFLYFFPTGQCVPQWMSVPSVLGAIFLVVWDVAFGAWGGPLDGWLMFGLLVSGALAQIWRYRRFSNRVQRQQTKWVVFGATASVTAFIAFSGLYPTLIPSYARTASFTYFFIDPVLPYLSLLFIPLSMAFSILRYRLYDIDLLINRTLVYGMLTGALALVYLGSVVLLQSLFRPLFGQGNDLAIVISTLAIAALFLPLRRRIQSFIDRRFYRRRYDAVKTLQAFSSTVRDEVDLNRLVDKLVEVVEETVQPAHVSLWLREPERKA